MAELWEALGRTAGASPRQRGRMVELIAARDGEGVSTVARELALYVARHLRQRVWLIDLDLMEQTQADVFGRNPERYGELGPAASASPDESMFFTVQPPLKRPDGRPWPDARYLSAHAVGAAPGLWVTRFRREALRGRQGVHVTPTGDYWTTLRRHADLVVVDAPSATRSQAGLTVSPFMDEVVLVVAADEADARAPAQLRDELEAAGAPVAGLFVNRVALDAPAFLRGARS
ncbi:MAG TPA: sugar kinase [Caulobacteraceae bacterium]